MLRPEGVISMNNNYNVKSRNTANTKQSTNKNGSGQSAEQSTKNSQSKAEKNCR